MFKIVFKRFVLHKQTRKLTPCNGLTIGRPGLTFLWTSLASGPTTTITIIFIIITSSTTNLLPLLPRQREGETERQRSASLSAAALDSSARCVGRSLYQHHHHHLPPLTDGHTDGQWKVTEWDVSSCHEGPNARTSTCKRIHLLFPVQSPPALCTDAL